MSLNRPEFPGDLRGGTEIFLLQPSVLIGWLTFH